MTNLKYASRSNANLKSRQRGMSIWVFLIVGILAFIVGGAALRVFPTYLEYMAVQSTIDKAALEASSPLEVKKAFNRMATIENITSINGDDLVIEAGGGDITISFKYEKRIPMAGPLNILMDYRGSASSSQ